MFNTKKIKQSEFGCDCLLLFILPDKRLMTFLFHESVVTSFSS